MENYKMVSLIPARGGSERIPRKNIKMLAGKPLLAWTIEASLNSKYIDRTFVSTEDPEIKKVALQYGAEVVDRPKKYAVDTWKGRYYEHQGIISSFKEDLWKMNYNPDYFAWLYCIFPLRTSKQIDEAFELMIGRNCTRVMTAWKMTRTACECFTIDKNGRAERVFDYTHRELYLRSLFREEFREPKYEGNGIIKIMRYRDINLEQDVNYADFALYIIDKEDFVDIDTLYDFAKAEYLLKERLKLNKKIERREQ